LLIRFCLYGFLKNQRYFEAFWVLAFLEMGLSFAMIGLLLGFREVATAILEIPAGLIADLLGRRWSLIAAHVAYIAAFVTFGLTSSVWVLFLAMLAFAIGEAFRSGTHKAIIFAWLKQQGREDEKTHVYGITRSWSKFGSAISVVIGAVCVFVFQDYVAIFWFSVIPTALNIVNFLGYPQECDGRRPNRDGDSGIVKTLRQGVAQCFSKPSLRRPIVESMGFEGMYSSSKDYLQPLVQQMALVLPLFVAFADAQRTAVMITVVYCLFYLLGGIASRYAGPILSRLGSEASATRWLWSGFIAAFALLLVGTLTPLSGFSIASLLLVAILQNLWRPILIGRVANAADEDSLATVFNVESLAKSLGVAMMASLIGMAITYAPQTYRFVPIAIFGILIGLVALASAGHSLSQQKSLGRESRTEAFDRSNRGQV